MSEVLWKLPYPSSGGVETEFKEAPGRHGNLFIYDTSGENSSYIINFEDVSKYTVTFLPQLSVEQIQRSYDRLVDCGQNDTRRFYEITFDDGPCYQVVASSFSIKESKAGV